MISYESFYWQKNELVLGMDEAGRGPLAGELVVAGVVFSPDYFNPEINDSKRLSAGKREKLYEIIVENALFYQLELVPVAVVDKLNIYQATRKAMERIATSLQVKNVLTDAMPLTLAGYTVEDIVKGDQKSISIAAASILAKVYRDKLMLEYDCQYPEYGFARHKGYPTKEHLEMIQKYGICPLHRLSFAPVRQVALDLGLEKK